MLIPDNLKSGVTKAHRYEPDLNPTSADLARNIAVIATYWLNFQSIRASAATTSDDSHHLALGVYPVLSLVAPFLKGEARELLQQISREYLK